MYLVIGGTFRYLSVRQAFYFGTKNNLITLSGYPPLNEHNQESLELNGLVDDEGKVVCPEAVPVLSHFSLPLSLSN